MKNSKIIKSIISDVIANSRGKMSDDCFDKLYMLFDKYDSAVWSETKDEAKQEDVK